MKATGKASRPDGENPKWTEEMMAGALPVGDLPPALRRKGRKLSERRADHPPA